MNNFLYCFEFGFWCRSYFRLLFLFAFNPRLESEPEISFAFTSFITQLFCESWIFTTKMNEWTFVDNKPKFEFCEGRRRSRNGKVVEGERKLNNFMWIAVKILVIMSIRVWNFSLHSLQLVPGGTRLNLGYLILLNDLEYIRNFHWANSGFCLEELELWRLVSNLKEEQTQFQHHKVHNVSESLYNFAIYIFNLPPPHIFISRDDSDNVRATGMKINT